jgi:hypothetical protein
MSSSRRRTHMTARGIPPGNRAGAEPSTMPSGWRSRPSPGTTRCAPYAATAAWLTRAWTEARRLNRSSGPHRPCAGWHRRPWSARRPPDRAGSWWPPQPRPWRQRSRSRIVSTFRCACGFSQLFEASWSLWKALSRSSAKSASGGTRSRVLGDPLDGSADGVCIRTPPPRARTRHLFMPSIRPEKPLPCTMRWLSALGKGARPRRMELPRRMERSSVRRMRGLTLRPVRRPCAVRSGTTRLTAAAIEPNPQESEQAPRQRARVACA